MRKRTALQVIRAFCVECQGNSSPAVIDCSDVACPFYPYRHGVALDKGAHRPLAAIRAYCRKHCPPDGADDIRTCGGDTALLGPCPVFPFRLGRNPNISEATREKRRQATLERGPVGIIAMQQSRIERPFQLPEWTEKVQAGA